MLPILALKPRGDVARSPKEDYDEVSLGFFFRISSYLNISEANFVFFVYCR